MMKIIRPAIVSLFVFTIITGLIYPLAVTGLAQLLFPSQANGSIILKGGKPSGSVLIGQQFDEPKYFWGRLSATGSFPYNSMASSGSNRGPNNPDLLKAVQERVQALQAADPGNTARIPIDLVTASGSGLDPHISPAAAEYQMKRVAKLRNLEEAKVRVFIEANTEPRQLGILGEPVVNVLRLNLALEELGQNKL